ncbi:MAG: hypothetical protein JJE25_03900, partial [Bacteroidia bacterium]|nr:hypothetical protein [Bacteroidia bacterium]
MKHNKLFSRILIANAFALFVVLVSSQTANAQVTTYTDYVMFSGNGGAGTTNPGSDGYGVIFGSGSTITGGAIGSFAKVLTTGGANFSANVFSGGIVNLGNGTTVSGRITAQNSGSVSGTILNVGSNSNLTGRLDANGNIVVQGGTVTGPVYTSGTYSGPSLPAGQPFSGPSFPTMPSLPPITTFPSLPSSGPATITNNFSASPGFTYGNVSLSNNKTLTLNGPGIYVFNSFNQSGNCNVVYDFQNNSTGVFNVYINGDAILGKFNASFANGGSASRIFWEIHGTGASSSTGKDAMYISNGSNGGNGSVKFFGTVWATKAAINIGAGTGSSQYEGALYSATQIYVQTGVTMTFSSYYDCQSLVANAGSNVSFCPGGSAQIGSAPVAGNTYSWSPTTGLSNSTIANPTVTLSTPGTTAYTVTVTHDACTATSSVNITVNPLPTANAGSNISFCAGGSGSIGSATVAGNTYSWSPTTGLSNSTVSNPTVSSSTPGTTVYTVTVTTTATSCTKTASVSVTVNPLPAADAGSNISFCAGGSGSIGSAAIAGNTYSWSPTTGLSSSTVANPTVSSSTPGSTIYTVTVTTTATGCSRTASVSVTVNPLPTADAGSNVSFCAEGSASIGSAPVSGDTYSWSPATGLSNSTIANPTVALSTPGTTTYTATVTTTSTGCTKTSSVDVTVNANPVPVVGSNSPICDGNTLNLTASGGTTYSWTGPNNFSSLNQNPSINNATIDASGSYFVNVGDGNNCHSIG